MELRVLRYFLAVAQEETISGAAEYLHITQPTLSRQLSELEDELGTKLFTRGNRRITLTEEGMLLRKRAQEIVELVEKTENELITAENDISGEIHIGSGETYAVQLLATVLKKVTEQYPKIKVRLYSGDADDVTERLDKGLLDFGLLIGKPQKLSKYDSISLPVVDTWGVLMRKDSPLADLEVVCPEDLWNVPLLGSRQTQISGELTKWLSKDPSSLNFVASYNLIYNASILVREGIGYALCLDKLIYTGKESDLCFRPLSPRLEASIDIAWKKNQVFSKAAELFLECLRNALTLQSG